MQHVLRPTERQVRDWLAMLGRLVAGSMSADEIGIRLDAYTPELMERYDSRDFDRTSREFVARQCKFFPSYGELCEALDKWPKPAAKPLQQPRQESGIPEGREPPDEAEIAAVHALVQEAIRGMKAARIPQSRPFSAPPKPPPDVTLHGDALRKSRAARGCSVPVPEPVPEPWPEHEEALF